MAVPFYFAEGFLAVGGGGGFLWQSQSAVGEGVQGTVEFLRLEDFRNFNWAT